MRRYREGEAQVDDLLTSNSQGKYLGKLALDGQGRIVFAATQDYSDTLIRRVLPSGTMDSSFAVTHVRVQGYDFAMAPNNGRARLERTDPAPFTIDLDGVEAVTLNMNAGDDTFNGSVGVA